MNTTLNLIRANGPCSDGWAKLLTHLGKTGPDDEPLDLLTILESNGLDDALWCLRAVDGFDREKRLLACEFARDVAHLNTDPRVMAAIVAAEEFAEGRISAAASAAARDAVYDVVCDVVYNAVRDAASHAVYDAAYDAAYNAAHAATSHAASHAARAKQEKAFRRMLAKIEGKQA